MRDAGELLHPVVVQTSVNTAAAAGDDDASQCDVIGTHPEHLLLTIIGSATRFVFYHHHCHYDHYRHRNGAVAQRVERWACDQ